MEDKTQSTTNSRTRHLHMRIGEMLVSRRVVTDAQVEEALKIQREGSSDRLLGQIFVDEGFATQQEVTAAVAACLGVPFVELHHGMVNPDIIASLPSALLQKYSFLPISMTDDWITVAMEDFGNMFAIEEISRAADRQVQVLAATPENLRKLRAEVLGERDDHDEDSVGAGLDDLIGEIAEDELEVVEETAEDNTDDLEVAATDSPVIKLVNLIVRGAVQRRASDIHIEPEDGTCRVRYRVDGELVEHMKPPMKLVPAIVSRIKIMSKLDISERRVPQDGGVRVMAFGRPIDIRVSTMPAKHGEKVVMRIIDNDRTKLNLESLGLVGDNLTAFQSVISEPNGILLVTGPTGSGKSTTLYAALSEMMSEKRNISTVEDPIEYDLRGVNQFQINTKAGFTFASALRALLRQDPDVIMVGEIRDVETARLAAEAALTGHFVLSTMHTNDAPSAIPRMVNMGVEPYLVAAALRGVMAQRLVRRICPECSSEKSLDDKSKLILEQIGVDPAEYDTVFEGDGCSRCGGSGFAGRTAIHEMLVVDEAMLSEVSNNMTLGKIRSAARKRGFRGLIDDGLRKVKLGQITLDGLLGVVSRSVTEE